MIPEEDVVVSVLAPVVAFLVVVDGDTSVVFSDVILGQFVFIKLFSFSLLSFHYLSVLDQTIQGASSLKSTVLELIALPGIFGDLLHTLISRFLENPLQNVVFRCASIS